VKIIYMAPALLLMIPNFAYAKGKKPSIQFEEDIIKGEVQKPDVNIFISKMNLDKAYELKLRESFIPKIKESIKKKPF